MAKVLAVAGEVAVIICIVILAILIWKTAEYFNRLPEKDRAKPVIAWDILVLILTLIALSARLIMM